MAKLICVHLKGMEKPATVRAETADENDTPGWLILKDSDGKIVGRFDDQQVVGWHVQEE